MLKIGWIGLGNMGTPMANNLLKAGFSLYVFNRTNNKTKELVQKGAISCPTPRDVAANADIVFTMLTDAAAVRQVLTQPDGVLAGLRSGKIVVDMSTVGPDDSRSFAGLVAKASGRFVDAPVSGSIKPATDGTLIILAGGQAEDIARCQPCFDALGKDTINFGGNGSGSSAKLVINLLLGITVQGISEVLLLAERSGLEREKVLGMIAQSQVGTPLVQAKKGMFLEENFPAAFMLKLMSKDLGLAAAEAEQKSIRLPLATAANTTFRAAKDAGKGDMDLAAVLLQLKDLSQ
ncbi:MAG: 3-hydroxyisobutyrate dehydrogenase [Firmicutes bacterium]|nr:3-hydroxyisobutyrate dehydrogenase [Bacillota bacterium]